MTTLANQLQALRVHRGGQEPTKRGVASLLFAPLEAADLDAEARRRRTRAKARLLSLSVSPSTFP